MVRQVRTCRQRASPAASRRASAAGIAPNPLMTPGESVSPARESMGIVTVMTVSTRGRRCVADDVRRPSSSGAGGRAARALSAGVEDQVDQGGGEPEVQRFAGVCRRGSGRRCGRRGRTTGSRSTRVRRPRWPAARPGRRCRPRGGRPRRRARPGPGRGAGAAPRSRGPAAGGAGSSSRRRAVCSWA